MANPDTVLWWTAFGAIAQAIGAAMTFAAVGLSLWIVLSERKFTAQGTASIHVMFAGDGTPGIYLIGVQVLNTGLRAFKIEAVGWRVGWLSKGPALLRHRNALQTFVTLPYPGAALPPCILEAGHNVSFYVSIAAWKAGNTDGQRGDLFDRTVKFLGKPPIRATIHISGRKPLVVKPDKGLTDFLRTGEHADTIG